jgi:hypothetical protein
VRSATPSSRIEGRVEHTVIADQIKAGGGARYRIAAGERILYGQRIDGVVRATGGRTAEAGLAEAAVSILAREGDLNRLADQPRCCAVRRGPRSAGRRRRKSHATAPAAPPSCHRRTRTSTPARGGGHREQHAEAAPHMKHRRKGPRAADGEVLHREAVMLGGRDQGDEHRPTWGEGPTTPYMAIPEWSCSTSARADVDLIITAWR